MKVVKVMKVMKVFHLDVFHLWVFHLEKDVEEGDFKKEDNAIWETT